MAAVNGVGGGWGFNPFNPQNYNLKIPKNTLNILKDVGIALCGIGACVLAGGAILGMMNPIGATIGAIALSILGIGLLSSRIYGCCNVPYAQQNVYVAPQPAVVVQQPPVVFVDTPLHRSTFYQNPVVGHMRGHFDRPMFPRFPSQSDGTGHAAVGGIRPQAQAIPRQTPTGHAAVGGGHVQPPMVARVPVTTNSGQPMVARVPVAQPMVARGFAPPQQQPMGPRPGNDSGHAQVGRGRR